MLLTYHVSPPTPAGIETVSAPSRIENQGQQKLSQSIGKSVSRIENQGKQNLSQIIGKSVSRIGGQKQRTAPLDAAQRFAGLERARRRVRWRSISWPPMIRWDQVSIRSISIRSSKHQINKYQINKYQLATCASTSAPQGTEPGEAGGRSALPCGQ
eukprot:SAG31_NODE_831_length_11669_cov_3.410026_9_plen_156_part_00